MGGSGLGRPRCGGAEEGQWVAQLRGEARGQVVGQQGCGWVRGVEGGEEGHHGGGCG